MRNPSTSRSSGSLIAPARRALLTVALVRARAVSQSKNRASEESSAKADARQRGAGDADAAFGLRDALPLGRVPGTGI